MNKFLISFRVFSTFLLEKIILRRIAAHLRKKLAHGVRKVGHPCLRVFRIRALFYAVYIIYLNYGTLV